jgi:peptidoglycan LD-endopeptidase LytH
MEVTLPVARVRTVSITTTFSHVLVVAAFALFAVGCATNKPQTRSQYKSAAPVVPQVTYTAPKPVHKTEAKLAEVPKLLFMPVKGVTQKQIANNFGDYRNGGRTHKGIDIFAPSGRELIATTSGYIERTSSKLGGNSIYLRGDNGLTYYYAHLSRYHPKAKSGDRVDGGMVIGYVGNTGNARSTPAHLHFEIRRQGVPFNPYSTLRDPDLVVTPLDGSTPVEYANYETDAQDRPMPAKNSGGAVRNSTSVSKAAKKSASVASKKLTGSSSKKLAAKKTKKQQLAAKKAAQKQKLAAKKASSKKKQYAKKGKASKKKYASKRAGRGHGSRG